MSPKMPADLMHPWFVELSAWTSPHQESLGRLSEEAGMGAGSSAETESQRNTWGNSGHPEGPGAVTPRGGHMAAHRSSGGRGTGVLCTCVQCQSWPSPLSELSGAGVHPLPAGPKGEAGGQAGLGGDSTLGLGQLLVDPSLCSDLRAHVN